MKNRVLFSCARVGLSVLECIDKDGNVIGCQVVGPDGVAIEGVMSLADAMKLFEELREQYLDDQLSPVETDHAYESPKP